MPLNLQNLGVNVALSRFRPSHLFEGVCLDSRHPDQRARVEGDTWTALRDTTSGDSGDSADSVDSGDEFQKPLPRASFWSNTPTLSLKSGKKTQKKHRVLSKINDFHIKSAKTLEVSHFFMRFARKVWHSKRFQWFSPKISKNAWSVARKQWFSPKISKNVWSVTLLHAFCKKSVTHQAFSIIFT